MYFKKINPRTTDLYSDASMFPRRTQAASQICFSKPILLVLPAIVFSPLHFVSVKSLERVKYYIREFGASHVGSYDPFRLVFWEDTAQELIDYFEWRRPVTLF